MDDDDAKAAQYRKEADAAVENAYNYRTPETTGIMAMIEAIATRLAEQNIYLRRIAEELKKR